MAIEIRKIDTKCGLKKFVKWGIDLYNNYSNYYDPDKYINQLGFSIGYGKRLTWPDNNFRFTATLGYTLYMMKDWEYFLITNGHCNNINLTLSLSRVSIDNAMFPRRGSQISASILL